MCICIVLYCTSSVLSHLVLLSLLVRLCAVYRHINYIVATVAVLGGIRYTHVVSYSAAYKLVLNKSAIFSACTCTWFTVLYC